MRSQTPKMIIVAIACGLILSTQSFAASILAITDSGKAVVYSNDGQIDLSLRDGTGKQPPISLLPTPPHGHTLKEIKHIQAARNGQQFLVQAKYQNGNFWSYLIYRIDAETGKVDWLNAPLAQTKPSSSICASKQHTSANSFVANATLTRVVFSAHKDLTSENKPSGACFYEYCLFESSEKSGWKPKLLGLNEELKTHENSELYPAISQISDNGEYALTYPNDGSRFGRYYITNLNTLETRVAFKYSESTPVPDYTFGVDGSYAGNYTIALTRAFLGKGFHEEREHFFERNGKTYLILRNYYSVPSYEEFNKIYDIYDASTLEKVSFKSLFPNVDMYNTKVEGKNPETGLQSWELPHGLYFDPRGNMYSLIYSDPFPFRSPYDGYFILDWSLGSIRQGFPMTYPDPIDASKKIKYLFRSIGGEKYLFISEDGRTYLINSMSGSLQEVKY